MKRIAVIGIRGFPGVQGGVEMHCQNIYPRLNNVQIRVYRRKPYLTQESLDAAFENVSFVDLPSTRIKGFEALFQTFLCVVHLMFHRVDVVHVHNMGPGLFAPVLRLLGMRVVMTYHSANYEHSKWGRVAKILLKWSEWVSMRCCHRVIFVNKFQMEKFSERFGDKCTYIPNGVNTPEITESTGFLSKRGISPGHYVLGVGRITQEKGFDVLVKAANQCSEVEQVVIAGGVDHSSGAEYLKQLKNLDLNGKVVFTGVVGRDELAELYSHARLFVLSSVNEGFPIVMLEAMSYGLPVMVSDIDATHLVELDKECYFKCGDAQMLSERLRLELNGGNACRRVDYGSQIPMWDAVAADTAKVLLEH